MWVLRTSRDTEGGPPDPAGTWRSPAVGKSGAEEERMTTEPHWREERRELKAELEKARRDAVMDPVTGTLSRRFFDAWLVREQVRSQRYGRPLALGFAAIDHMARWNSVRGVESGDRVLHTVGELLERSCRASDIVARFEGDTFAVAFPETELFSAREVAAMLCLQVARFDWGEAFSSDEPVTLSIGLVAVESAKPLGEAFSLAARHLDRARSTGRNRVFAGGVL